MILRADDMLFYLAGEERALERTFEWIWAGDKWATQHMRRGSTFIGGSRQLYSPSMAFTCMTSECVTPTIERKVELCVCKKTYELGLE
jgi:hypothetical protein